MCECESWTMKKAECQRIDDFERWHWRRLLRVPWTERRSHQSILKEISPEYSLEGLMLKLKLQYFGHLMWRTDSLEKTLMLGKIEGRRRKGMTEGEMVGWHHWLDGHDFEQALGVGDGQGGLECCSPWGVAKSQIRLSYWTELNWTGDDGQITHVYSNCCLYKWERQWKYQHTTFCLLTRKRNLTIYVAHGSPCNDDWACSVYRKQAQL